MICKHFYYFTEIENQTNNKLDQEKWDLLRMSSVNSPFSIEKNIEEYEENNKKDENKSYKNMARIMCNNFLGNSYRIVSLGVGKGILEWHLKQIRPDLKIDCADYTVNSLNQLKKVFVQANDFFVYDMIKDDWETLNGYDCLILFRMSTEFDKKTWKEIFKKMHDANIKNVIFVPTGLDNLKTMCEEMFCHYLRFFSGKKDHFCGWLYSEKEFLSMWDDFYRISESISYESTKLCYLERK